MRSVRGSYLTRPRAAAVLRQDAGSARAQDFRLDQSQADRVLQLLENRLRILDKPRVLFQMRQFRLGEIAAMTVPSALTSNIEPIWTNALASGARAEIGLASASPCAGSGWFGAGSGGKMSRHALAAAEHDRLGVRGRHPADQSGGKNNFAAYVVYVDYDPVVVSHAQALLSGSQTAAIRGDVCHPEQILGAPEVRRLIDFSQPVAVLMLAVLHVIPDEADPAGAVARLREAMAPGSYLAISHADVSPTHVVGTRRLTRTARELEEAVTSLQSVPARTRDEITGFFGDLTLVEPGLTDIWAWRLDGVTAATTATTSDFMRILGGVATKR
jgi:S-adenosyl methyltransferase